MFKLLIFFHRVRYDPMVSDRPDVPYLTRFQNIRSDPGRAGLLMKHISHPNVLSVTEVSETTFPYCIVSPWMPDGNITQYTKMNPGANRLMLVRARQLGHR